MISQADHSAESCRSTPSRRRAFTLLEMLTTVAALVIILGLMVSLARHVRSQSADRLTRELLKSLEEQLAAAPAVEELLTSVPPLVSPELRAQRRDQLDEDALQLAALINNQRFVSLWNEHSDNQAFARLPLSIYDEKTLRDAWGTPIVYMPPNAANIGIQPQSRRFFLSAGPDRTFKTVVDNLYSYERVWTP